MTTALFQKQLGILSLVVIAILVATHQIVIFGNHQILSWISCTFFISFCLILYSVGNKASQSDNKHLFGQVFLVGSFFKMLLSVFIIIGYAIVQKPSDLVFVFPFFAIYTIFTAYEVYFMTKLAKK